MIENEVFVRFILTGFNLDASDLTKELGITPTKTWRKNELKASKGVLKHKENGWEISMKVENIYYVDEPLKNLIELLRPAKIKITNMGDVKKIFSIVIYSNSGMPSIFYDLDIISFVHDIKATIDQDIYCLAP